MTLKIKRHERGGVKYITCGNEIIVSPEGQLQKHQEMLDAALRKARTSYEEQYLLDRYHTKNELRRSEARKMAFKIFTRSVKEGDYGKEGDCDYGNNGI